MIRTLSYNDLGDHNLGIETFIVAVPDGTGPPSDLISSFQDGDSDMESDLCSEHLAARHGSVS